MRSEALRGGSESLGGKRHVWAVVQWGGFLCWEDVSGVKFTAVDYQNFLHQTFPALPETIFMQDGASVYRASVSVLEDWGINVLHILPI